MADTAHSTRMYKTRLHIWGVKKYRSAAAMRYVRPSSDVRKDSAKSWTWSTPNRCISASPGTPPKDAARKQPPHVSSFSLGDHGSPTIKDADQHQKAVNRVGAGPDSCDKSTALEADSTLRFDSQLSTPPASTSLPAHQGYQDSGSVGVPSAGTSHLTNVHRTVEKSTIECDEEESDAWRKRRKITFGSSETKALACPFYKYNPRRYNPQNEDMDSAMRYRTCAGPGWESISRLRYRHLVWFSISLADPSDNICFVPTFL
jgi:hypothetical protein